MHRHRFIIPQVDLNSETITIVDSGILHQLKDVLKIAVGEEIVIADGEGGEARAAVVSFSPGVGVASVIARQKNKNESSIPVAVYCAVLKHDNFDLVVQKATEIGVQKIVPIITQRTVKRGVNEDRLQKIAKEAAEQSGRGVVPIVEEPVVFDKILEEVKAADGLKIFLDADGERLNSGEIGKIAPEKVAIFVGPEGGWTPAERERAQTAGCVVRSLGKLILRAETAAIVASYEAVNAQ